MRVFKLKVFGLTVLFLLLILTNMSQAEDKRIKLWNIQYRDAVFMINQSFPINLNNDPETTLKGRPCIETQWLAVRYYKLMDCPVRLSVLGKDLYGIQFIFANDGTYQIDISLYDLQIHDGTQIAELERYFKQHQIEYTKGKDNIATSFAIFYYLENKIGLCEFRTVILKNYESYYFKRTGEAPWWLT